MRAGERRSDPGAVAPFGRRASDRIDLTARQREVLEGVSRGLENKEIAARLGISEQAVKQQVSVLLRKFAAQSRAMLAQHAMAMRLLGGVGALDVPVEHFFDRAPIMMAVSRGPRHEIRLVNREFTCFFGDREYVGLTVSDCFPTATSRLLGALDRVFASGQAWRDTERHIRFDLPDGTRREAYLSLVAEPIRGEGDAVQGLAFYAWDVTEAANTRRRLTRASREHEALLEQLPIGVIYTDERARPVLMNRMARQIFGGDLDPDRPIYAPLPGRTVRYASDGRPVAPSEGPSARALGGWPFDGELLITTGERSQVVHVSARPLYGDRGQVTGAALVVTQRPAGHTPD